MVSLVSLLLLVSIVGYAGIPCGIKKLMCARRVQQGCFNNAVPIWMQCNQMAGMEAALFCTQGEWPDGLMHGGDGCPTPDHPIPPGDPCDPGWYYATMCQLGPDGCGAPYQIQLPSVACTNEWVYGILPGNRSFQFQDNSTTTSALEATLSAEGVGTVKAGAGGGFGATWTQGGSFSWNGYEGLLGACGADLTANTKECVNLSCASACSGGKYGLGDGF